MNTGPISNPSIFIRPSKSLYQYLISLEVSHDIPAGIANVVFKNQKSTVTKPSDPKYLTTEEDRQFLQTLKLSSNVDITKLSLDDGAKFFATDKLLSLQDLHWLHSYLCRDNETRSKKTYLHELLEGSEIILPKNSEIPRNEELEKRCERLRATQQNREYSTMTKNVDNVRRKHPEDTIAFQMKQMNRHLIAIAQFIMSVLAGFAFGFIGVELLIGSLDFGFRLLLGIICALTIALAELYFLAKKLNEDLKFDSTYEENKKTTKID